MTLLEQCAVKAAHHGKLLGSVVVSMSSSLFGVATQRVLAAVQ
jgi:hypothetical protein